MAHGITAMKKHIKYEHNEVFSKYYADIVERRIESPSIGERQPAKKRDRVTLGYISSFFSSNILYKKTNE